MFNKILKKLLLRFVTNFSYLSTLFFVCTLFFVLEMGFNTISVAKASTNNIQKSKKSTEISNIIESGILKNTIEIPRSQVFDKDGSAHLLKEHKGKFVILYLWATWCMDCVNELIKLDNLAKELKYREIDDLSILPITIDFKSPEQLDSFLKQKGIGNIHYFLDPKKEIMGELGVHSLPRSFLINEEGYIIASYNKPIDWTNEIVFEKLLQMKKSSKSQANEKLNSKGEVKEDDKNKSPNIMPEENSHIKTKKQPTFIG